MIPVGSASLRGSLGSHQLVDASRACCIKLIGRGSARIAAEDIYSIDLGCSYTH